MFTTTRSSPSFTRKYGAAARTSLNGAVLWMASMVSHCLSVIWSCQSDLSFSPSYPPCKPHVCTHVLGEYTYKPLPVKGRDWAWAYLVNNSIPSKPSIIHQDMDFAVSKFRRSSNQFSLVRIIQDIPDDSDSLPAVLRDQGSSSSCLFYFLSAVARSLKKC